MRSTVLVGLGLWACAVARPAAAAPVVTADDVCPAAADPCLVQADFTVAPGVTLDFGARHLVVKQGKQLDAGTGSMQILAGAVTVEAGGALRARGGAVSVLAAGPITVLRAGNTVGRIDVAGVPAGIAVLTAAATVRIEGTVDAAGADLAVPGGTVRISGDDVVITGLVDAHGGRSDGSAGGDVDLAAAGMVTLNGRVDASGADGGTVTIDAGTGLAVAGDLDVHGIGNGGYGGDVVLTTARGPATITAALQLDGNDGVYGGDGGQLEVLAGDSLTLGGDIRLVGAPPDGTGGDVIVEAGVDLVQAGSMAVFGKGESGIGGAVDLLAGRRLVVGPLDVHGTAAGGSIVATAGCELEVPTAATLEARGAAHGTVDLVGGGSVLVAGTIRASMSVELVTSPGGSVSVTGPAPTPAAAVHEDPTIPPCGGPQPAGCGNGLPDPGEECDDANLDPCDACTNGCRLPVCGNGVVDCHEACDDGGQLACDGCAADCSRYDAVCGDTVAECGEQADDGGTAACDGVSPTCVLETCGNGVVDCGEECDAGPASSAECNPACRTVAVGCGDGVVAGGEECDDGNTADCDGCSHLCLAEGPGNGIVECAEACDDGNRAGCDGCAPDGHLEQCGNGILDCGEQCDAGAANGTSASACLPDVCVLGELCTPSSTGACIPCASARDCGPLGVCGGDACVDGVCLSGTAPACDDGDACTADGCDPDVGCTSTAVACDDGDPCTADACDPGAGCRHEPGACIPLCTPAGCDDGDACTVDGCDAADACTHDRRTGVDGIRCALDALDAFLAAAPPGDVGARTRRKLGRVLAAMRAKLSALGVGDARKAARGARGFAKLRARAVRTVSRARDVSPSAAARLQALLGTQMPAATPATRSNA